MIELARRYAQAFLNVKKEVLSFAQIASLQELCEFFRNHRRMVFFLKVAALKEQVKVDAIAQLCEQYGLQGHLDEIVRLLCVHKRLSLLPEILCYVRDYYLKKTETTELVVYSSSQLLHDEREKIEEFISQRIGGRVLYRYDMDSNLIAGVRIVGTTWLWEYSVAKQLRDMRISLLR